jgi:hypothetical protein
MKQLELSAETKTAKWYKFFWNKNNYYMPKDTCTYYRNTIFSILLIPFTFLGLIFSAFTKKCNKTIDRIWVTIMVPFLPLILGSMWYDNKTWRGVYYGKLWLMGLGTLVGILIIVAIIILAFAGIDVLSDWIKDRSRKKKYMAERANDPEVPKEPNVLVAWFKQLKDRTCSKIKWVGEDNPTIILPTYYPEDNV